LFNYFQRFSSCASALIEVAPATFDRERGCSFSAPGHGRNFVKFSGALTAASVFLVRHHLGRRSVAIGIEAFAEAT
jgi:hypothetical protein